MKKMGTNMDPGKAPKEYSKEDIEFSLAVTEVERTIKNLSLIHI